MNHSTTCSLLVTCLLVAAPMWAVAGNSKVAILAQNDGTEITDLLVPYALMSAAGVDVTILSTEQGLVNLMNGMELLSLSTIESAQPQDFELVIVPAVHDDQQPQLLRWLNAAHDHGATVASICDGVEVLAEAGILDGRRATGHFYSANRRQRVYPKVLWQENVRFVEDGRVFTTAGISASAPASIYLLEKLVGADSAAAVASAYGVKVNNGASHDSASFSVGLSEVAVGVKNLVLGLRKRQYNLQANSSTDEFVLAFTADALSRTFRAALAIDATDDTIITQHGLYIRGRKAFRTPDWTVSFGRSPNEKTSRSKTIDLTGKRDLLTTLFSHIDQEFGAGTAILVGLQLELPSRGAMFYD